MLRIRFKTSAEDYRPVKWPIPHPYWCSGRGDDFWIIVAYADDETQVMELWPEAYELDSEQCESYTFTDRFPRPEWFAPEETNEGISPSP